MIACDSLDRVFAEHVEPKQRIDMIVDGRAVSGLQDRHAGRVPRDSVATGARTLAAVPSIVIAATRICVSAKFGRSAIRGANPDMNS
jgi:hypothetical protein